MKHGPIAKKIIEWLEAKGWKERPEPTQDKKLSKVAFIFAAGGEFELDCLLMADEFGAGMLTMIAAPDFSILKSNIDEVRNFCGHFRKQYGNIYVMDDGTFKYIHSRAMESFANNIDDVPVEAENMINEMDEYISWLFPFIIDISNGLKDAKECVRQAKKKIPPRTVQEKESIGSDQCKIETLKNKSIVERRIFSKNNKKICVETLWREGYVVVKKDEQLKHELENFEPNKGIQVYSLNIVNQNFNNGNVRLVFHSKFSEKKKIEISSVFSEGDEDGLESIGYSFDDGECWFFGELEVHDVPSKK
ncbi:hypothetical protein G6677_06935 [Polynucleobacter paneuropaeus]|nr:hypothetical protein [Polynucleobacter paneuropaeus]